MTGKRPPTERWDRAGSFHSKTALLITANSALGRSPRNICLMCCKKPSPACVRACVRLSPLPTPLTRNPYFVRAVPAAAAGKRVPLEHRVTLAAQHVIKWFNPPINKEKRDFSATGRARFSLLFTDLRRLLTRCCLPGNGGLPLPNPPRVIAERLATGKGSGTDSPLRRTGLGRNLPPPTTGTDAFLGTCLPSLSPTRCSARLLQASLRSKPPNSPVFLLKPVRFLSRQLPSAPLSSQETRGELASPRAVPAWLGASSSRRNCRGALPTLYVFFFFFSFSLLLPFLHIEARRNLEA